MAFMKKKGLGGENAVHKSVASVSEVSADTVKSVNLLPEKKNKKKILGIVLGAVGALLIIGVVVGVLIWHNSIMGDEDNDSALDSGDSECPPSSENNSEETEIEDASQWTYDGEYAESIETALSNMAYGNVPEVLAIYGQYKEKVSGEEKMNLLSDELTWLLDNDLEKAYGGEAIKVALELDELQNSINSAAVVASVAQYYGDEALLEEYTKILDDREEAEGIDPDVETVG